MNEKHSFCVAAALTAQGSVDFWESNLSRVSKALILQSLPGVSVPAVLSDIEQALMQQSVPFETFLRARGKSEIACLVIDSRLAVLDSSLLGSAQLPGEAERVIVQVPMNSRWDTEQRSELNNLHAQTCRAASRMLQKALQLHDEWEDYHIRVLDKDKCNQAAQEMARELFPMQFHEKPRIRHRFLGASTASGAVNCIASQTARIPQRIFLKGRPGTGKSTFLKKLAAAAGRRGLDHDLYHCSFDSHSLDMLVVPQADVCLMDATEPHAVEPEREGDRVLDLYELLIPEGTDEAHEAEIASVRNHYNRMVQEARSYMVCASSLLDTFYQGIDIPWTRQDSLNALAKIL